MVSPRSNVREKQAGEPVNTGCAFTIRTVGNGGE